MKEHLHNHKENYFTLFLIAYCILLIIHVSEIPFVGLQSYGVLLTGIILAIFSHKRHGYETLILLLIHMSFEWWQHSHQLAEYGLNELLLSGIHVIFDGVFLWEELKVHLKKKLRIIVVATLLIGISGMFVVASYDRESSISHEHHNEGSHHHSDNNALFEIFIMGGIMGCIISHALLRKNQ